MGNIRNDLKFLTLVETAEILRVSKRTLLRMIKQKKIPSLKVGGQWRILERRLTKWTEQNQNRISQI